ARGVARPAGPPRLYPRHPPADRQPRQNKRAASLVSRRVWDRSDRRPRNQLEPPLRRPRVEPSGEPLLTLRCAPTIFVPGALPFVPCRFRSSHRDCPSRSTYQYLAATRLHLGVAAGRVQTRGKEGLYGWNWFKSEEERSGWFADSKQWRRAYGDRNADRSQLRPCQ